MSTPSYLTIRTASLDLDGISETKIREACAAGELRHARFGAAPKPGAPDRRPIRIKREDLDAWVESQMGGAA